MDFVDPPCFLHQLQVNGPSSCVVAASDLLAKYPLNSLMKYADDTHLLMGSCNISIESQRSLLTSKRGLRLTTSSLILIKLVHRHSWPYFGIGPTYNKIITVIIY